MAEEHRFQPPRPCANNCGFFRSRATRDLCSKCFHDLQLKEQKFPSIKQSLDENPSSMSQPSVVTVPSVDMLASERVESKCEHSTAVVQPPNRCVTCRKRVGLTGFKCKCGFVFCGTHRYPEHHGCEFDYKGMGKEIIRNANPAVKSEKLQKI